MDISSTNPTEYDVHYDLIAFRVTGFKFDEFDLLFIGD
tara:strand:- start:2040 stop:2153 length:114 start_codon:yes stop_codon:yes gene_type:complete